MGINVIEPLTTKNERCLAKPALFQKINEKLKDYKAGYLAPKRINSTTDSNKRSQRVIVKP